MKESSTFGFPPSVHGAVGALGDVAVFDREVNGGSAFRNGGGATSGNKRRVTGNSLCELDGASRVSCVSTVGGRGGGGLKRDQSSLPWIVFFFWGSSSGLTDQTS